MIGLREADAIDETTNDGKEQADAKKKNAVAMANLMMAFTSETTMGLVWKAKTSDWPGGLVHLVVASFFKKFQPQDTLTRVAEKDAQWSHDEERRKSSNTV